ncbi:MAG: DUF58 domain-containing protein [Lachnospiraceae bacterium]|nr:DUF58 domain-containing protein [Lachnospiraceae bacterium]
MKRNRSVFAILWVLSLVAISFYGGPVSYGLFAVLTLLPLVSLAYLCCVYIFFRIYQELDGKQLVANHTVPFYFTLMNEFHFGFCGIRVHFFSSFSTISGLDDGVEYELLPKTGIKKQTNLVCKYRGEYEVGIKSVEIEDYFRLMHVSYHNRETLRVIVKPNLVELSDLGSIDLSQTMARESLINPTEPDVLVRNYEIGDDVRQINWKASARSGELLIRKKTGEEREGVCVLLGTNRCSKEMKEYLPVENKMLETKLALTMFFAKKSISTHVYYQASELVEKGVSGLEQFDAFYESVCSISFRDDVTEPEFLANAARHPEIFRCKTAFLVLHDWTEEALQMLRLLRENNVFAITCLIRDEIPDNLPGAKMPGVEILQIGTEDDLTEVLT